MKREVSIAVNMHKGDDVSLHHPTFFVCIGISSKSKKIVNEAKKYKPYFDKTFGSISQFTSRFFGVVIVV